MSQVSPGAPHPSDDGVDTITVSSGFLFPLQDESDRAIAGDHALGIAVEGARHTVGRHTIRTREREQGAHISGQVDGSYDGTVEAAGLE